MYLSAVGPEELDLGRHLNGSAFRSASAWLTAIEVIRTASDNTLQVVPLGAGRDRQEHDCVCEGGIVLVDAGMAFPEEMPG